jgi:hypothetical protein
MNQRKRLIVHLDVIVMRTVSVIGQGRRIEREAEVRNVNLEARDMMVSSPDLTMSSKADK